MKLALIPVLAMLLAGCGQQQAGKMAQQTPAERWYPPVALFMLAG